MTDKCCFCEGGEWGKFAHVGCLVKASVRPLLTTDEVLAFNNWLIRGGHPYRNIYDYTRAKHQGHPDGMPR